MLRYCTDKSLKGPDGVTRTEIGTRIGIASFCSGYTPTQTIRFLNLIGAGHYSLPVIDALNKEMTIQLKIITDAIFKLALKETLKME